MIQSSQWWLSVDASRTQRWTNETVIHNPTRITLSIQALVRERIFLPEDEAVMFVYLSHALTNYVNKINVKAYLF